MYMITVLITIELMQPSAKFPPRNGFASSYDIPQPLGKGMEGGINVLCVIIVADN
jgi:hypothetical protein